MKPKSKKEILNRMLNNAIKNPAFSNDYNKFQESKNENKNKIVEHESIQDK